MMSREMRWKQWCGTPMLTLHECRTVEYARRLDIQHRLMLMLQPQAWKDPR